MPSIKTQRLQIKQMFDAPPEDVFDAWTNPEALKVFHAPMENFTIPVAEVDLRVGGRYRINMRAPDGNSHVAAGTYREILRSRKLVFTWGFESGGNPDGSALNLGETLITLEFRSKGKGTEFILTHDFFPSAEQKENHLHGWMGIVGRLQQFLRK